MRKIIPISLLMAVLMGACAWSISWFLQARAIRQSIETSIAQFDPALGSVKIASVTTSGFPAKMIITISKPDVTLYTKPILSLAHKYSMAAAGNSAGVLTTPTYPESTLHYALDGSITLTLNALANDLLVQYAGNDSQQLAQADSSITIATEPNGINSCNIKLQGSFSTLFSRVWDIQKFFTANNILEHLSEFRCDLPGSVTTDMATHQVVASLSPSQVLVTNTQAGEQVHGLVRLKLDGYEVMPAGDILINRLRQAITPIDQTFSPIAMSLYGKQALSLELAMELPKNKVTVGQDSFKIDMRNFQFSSNANVMEGNFLLSSATDGKHQQGEFSVHFTSEFTPLQAEITRANMGQIVREALNSPQLSTLLANVDKKNLENSVFNALPNFSQLGKINENIQINYRLEKERKSGEINVNALDISTAAFGINGSGQASLFPEHAVPTINANLTCKNCMAMIDTMAAYLARVEAVAVVISPDNAGTIAPSPSQQQAVKQLLQIVGTADSTTNLDLNFAIKSDARNVNINGKSLPELMQIMQQTIGSATLPAAAPRTVR